MFEVCSANVLSGSSNGKFLNRVYEEEASIREVGVVASAFLTQKLPLQIVLTSFFPCHTFCFQKHYLL